MQVLKSLNKVAQKLSVGRILNTSILHNKLLLYVVFLMLLVNMYSQLVIGNYRFLATVFLIGFLTSQFTKNMMVIMFISLTVANALRRIWTGTEGFESKEDGEDGEEDEKVGEDDGEEKDGEEEEGMTTQDKMEKKETKDAVDSEVKTNPEINKLMNDKNKLVALKKDAEDLLTTQKEILSGLNKMEPLLNRAEKLSEKFSTRK